MKKLVYLLCTGALAFSLMGCSSVIKMSEMAMETMDEDKETADTEAEEEPDAAEDMEEPAEQEEPTEEAAPAEEEAPLVEETWQVLYKELLEELRQGEFGDDIPFFGSMPGEEEYQSLMEYGYTMDGYTLYDVDKNGVPELIVKFGTCEADYDGRLYTFDGTKVVYVDEFAMGHTSIYTYPDGNGMILDWGHMGSQYMTKLTMVDGAVEYEYLFDETLDELGEDDYTSVEEVVPGAQYLSMMKAVDTLPVDTYKIWSANLNRDIDYTTKEDPKTEQIYLDTIYQNGTVFGVSADGYGGDVGSRTFEEYLEPYMVQPYSASGMMVSKYTFLDLNEDGKEECVLKLVDKEQDADYAGTDLYVVLSEQDGVVYAYSIHYYNEYVLLENGAFRPNSEYFSSCFRIMFDKDQCFMYYVAPDEKHAEWAYMDY